MTPQQYQEEVRRTNATEEEHFSLPVMNNTFIETMEATLRKPSGVSANMLHHAIGIATESGELLDALKKGLFYGKGVDVVNVQEELGDVLWYVANLCNELDVPMEHVMQVNINKLRKRFPEKFTEDHANNRDLDSEAQTLNAGFAKKKPGELDVS